MEKVKIRRKGTIVKLVSKKIFHKAAQEYLLIY